MKNVKKVLFKILNEKTYLKTLHRVFYLLYNLGVLKGDERFKYHYKVKQLIEPHFTVVDIGANLGYFSKNFARLAHRGTVVSIEPVPQFFEVLQFFMRKFPHARLHNVALGTENGSVTMVLPQSDGVIRTGLPHVARSEEEKKEHTNQEVKLVRGSELLSDLAEIHYIKCDIEGYELVVFQELKPLIERHQPFVQIEIAEKNLAPMLGLFASMNYTQFGIKEFNFIQENGKQAEEGDFFFVPANRLEEFNRKFQLN